VAIDDRAKTPRTLLVADHLWEALASMAVEMGADREALINQALYTFARLNGFLVPADLQRITGHPLPPPKAETGRPRPMLAPPLSGERPLHRPPANPDRVAEIAQQLAGSGMPSRSGPNPSQVLPTARLETPALVEVDDPLLGDEGRATNMDLPDIAASLAGFKQPASIIAPHRIVNEVERSEPGADTPGGPALVLLADGRELDRVVKDRFLIGRGKHCDLIINSGKVSREHAAITREGSSYFIEDLGSSNGTWFDKRRISRRQIQEGDEYYICSEKLSCSFR
jgi:hypothetical protein